MTPASVLESAGLQRLFGWSRRRSFALQRRLEIEDDKPLWQRFERSVHDALGELPDGGTFVDLGGGRRCVYAAGIPADRPVRTVAVDISAEELALNGQVSETRVADVSSGLPFDDGEVDLLVSRALMEHVDGVPAAANHIARVMKPGGRTIHFMSGRYAIFALAARWLPFEPLLKVVHALLPESVGQVEFDVVYDHTDPVAIERIFREAGFRKVSVEWTPAQVDYFRPVLPLFLLVAVYQRVVRALGLRRLAAYLVVTAER
jgi:SAM-dependent methyltransferase